MKNLLQRRWLTCLAGTLVAICALGINGNVFSVYLPFISLKGLTGAQSSMLVSLRCVFTLIAMFWTDRYYRRLRLRLGLTISVFLSAVGNLLFSYAEDMAFFTLAAAISGLSYGFGSMIPLSILMRNWFGERSVLALGVCAAGSGLSTICFPPILTRLIAVYGMSFAFRTEAVFAASCSGLTWLMIRDAPTLEEPRRGSCGVEREDDLSGYAASHQQMRILTLAMVLLGGVTTAAIGHLPILLAKNGCSSNLTAGAVSVFGITLTLGKFIFGWISDHCGGQRASLLSCGLLLLGCTLFCVWSGTDSVAVYLPTVLLGCGYPVASLGSSVWAADFSSNEHYANSLRRFQIAYQCGGIVFSFVSGLLYDVTGSYRVSFAFFAVLMVIMLLMIQENYRVKKLAGF